MITLILIFLLSVAILLVNISLIRLFKYIKAVNIRLIEIERDAHTAYFFNEKDFKWKNKSKNYWEKILNSPRRDRIQYESR
jgi:hypothetical protein